MHIEKTLTFQVPRDALWEYLRDKEKFQAVGYVERVEVEKGTWPEEGTRGRIHVRLREKTYIAPYTLEKHVDGRDLLARVTGGPLDGASFYFHALDGPDNSTVLTGGFKLGGLLGLAARASGLQERIANAVDRELRAFKEKVEAGAAAASPAPG